MKKILIIHHSQGLFAGGVETYLINILSRMDRSSYDITFLVPGKITSAATAKKLNSLVNRSIYLGLDVPTAQTPIFSKCKFHFSVRKCFERLQKKDKYDIVYINATSVAYQANLLAAAKQWGIPRRIAHSRNTIIPGNAFREVVHDLLKKSIVRNATDLLACSRPAAESLFGKEAGQRATVIKNGIDIRRFAFSTALREECREQLGYARGDYVIGHVGRFAEQKNHRFLIDVFYEVSKACPEARLLLLGEGELQDEIRQRVSRYGLDDRVIFAGVTEQTERYYCAMDVFVLPSIYEGFGNVNMEAQASGLSCVVSDQVPREADVSGRVEFLPLGDAAAWRDSLLKYKGLAHERENDWRDVYDAGYVIEKTVQTLTELFDK